MFAITLCLILMASSLSGCGENTADQWQEQYDLGEQYLLEMDYEQAIVAFTAAIEIEPNEVDAYIGRAESYYALGISETDAGEAINADSVLTAEASEYLEWSLADYETVLELDDSMVALYLNEANVYMMLSKYEAATDAYRSAIDGGVQTVEAYVGAAEAYIAMDDYDGAARILEEGKTVYPDEEELQELEEEVYILAAKAQEEAEKEARQTIAEEYLQEALAYEEAGELNAAIHTIYMAYDYWEDYEPLYEAWKRLYVPITSIMTYNSMGVFMIEVRYEFDEIGRLVQEAEATAIYLYDEFNGTITITGYFTQYTWYEYEDEDWVYDSMKDGNMTGYFPDSTSGDFNSYSEYTREPETGISYPPTLPELSVSTTLGVFNDQYCIFACPYSAVLNEDILYEAEVNNGNGSGFGSGYSDLASTWSYAEITYDDRGLVTRMDFYDEKGGSSGYAELQYGN